MMTYKIQARILCLLLVRILAPVQVAAQDVEVRVTQETQGNLVQYHYAVANNSPKAIRSVIIGMNDNVLVPELTPPPLGWTFLNAIPSGSVASPSGWTVAVETMEESEKVQVQWVASDAQHRLAPGGSLTDFALRLGATSDIYLNAHWTVVFDDGLAQTGQLIQTNVTGPAPQLPTTAVTLSQDSYSLLTVGTPVTWTASANNSGTRWYQYLLNCEDVNQWRVVQDYSPQNTFVWTPSSAAVCDIQVRLKNDASQTDYDAATNTDGLTISPGEPLAVTSYTANVSFPSPTGTPIIWTATTSGGVGGPQLQYQFWLRDPVIGWRLLRDYGTGNSVTWTPLKPGVYDTQVWVRNAGSTEPYDAWGSNVEAVTISEGPVSIVSLKANSQLPVAPGTPVTWTIEAAGGTAPLEYSFELFTQSSGTWTTARPYNSSATWTLTPVTSDSYTVRALVRVSGSTAQYDDISQSNTFSCVSGPIVNAFMTTNQTFPIATPVPITFMAQAAGGSAPLEYKFYLNDVTKGTWTLVRDWSPTNQWSWSPTEADYGKWAVQVWIRSTGSPAPYEAYTGTGFFVLLR